MSRPVSLLAAGLLAAVAVPVLAAAPAGAAAPAPAALTVVHGVRGLVADVRLDGTLVLGGFAPERVTDPLPVPPGRHHVQAWPTGASAGTPPVIDTEITLTSGERATAGIGLTAAGTPTIILYDDATLLPTAGSTALAVRGLARSVPVQVLAGDRTVAPALAPGQEQVAQVSAGTYPVSVRTADRPTPVVPPQDVPVTAGRATVLYLIGSQPDGTLGWVAQTVAAAQSSAPTRVDTGVGPLPDGRRSPLLPTCVVLVVLGGAGVAARRTARG